MTESINTQELKVEKPDIRVNWPQIPVTISVYSPKGGTGKSTIAREVATFSALCGFETILVDCDLEFGDIGTLVCGMEKPNILDLLKDIKEIKGKKEILPYLVREVETGLYALLAPDIPEAYRVEGEYGFADKYGEIIRALKVMFQVIVMDCGITLKSRANQHALLQSDRIIMIADLSRTAKRGVEKVIAGFERIDILPKTGLIINKVGKDMGRTVEDIESEFSNKLYIIGQIPLFPEMAQKYANNQISILFSGDKEIIGAYQRVMDELSASF